ncbi:CTLH/CRA C-terminal to lish motif domain-containing protein [Plectosphaerella plurivora]|uniref:GID complex catalytic subunit 2 n=1 Tax=Plectosphaerella plurivora TaxID=936078 RepID=A0A9P8VJB8_9PEZI|nr:CTLH/CRA C-terminal to lish motif domain-containing protein [Plectosphaerella plurivora]
MAEPNPMTALQAELARFQRTSLHSAVRDADKILQMLIDAREDVANASDPHNASLIITKLQNPVATGFDNINVDLKEISKAQKVYGKALDKNFPSRALPTEYDVMASHPSLINRAIAMHMLREGQFGVASTFLRESHEHNTPQTPTSLSAGAPDIHHLQSQELQNNFASMYSILHELKSKNLMPAIRWAHQNSRELEARGSNLEFELTKLQFIWLFQGPSINGLPDDEHNGRRGATAYAQVHFPRFQKRHRPEIQRLSCALLFAPNLAHSPYAHLFTPYATVFEDVATSFTREFCSLLGLSAESPLYLAATAGAIALPQLLKYTSYMKAKRTEWTTENELAFETPLPKSMIYHPIFVCPVSKEQTTDDNPPMMLQCGHVICKESLHRLAKGQRYKCPYCPTEGQLSDTRQIAL